MNFTKEDMHIKTRQIVGSALLLSILPVFTGIVGFLTDNHHSFMVNMGIVYLIEFAVILFVIFVIYCANLIFRDEDLEATN